MTYMTNVPRIFILTIVLLFLDKPGNSQCNINDATIEIRCPSQILSAGTETLLDHYYIWYHNGSLKEGPRTGTGSPISYNFTMSSDIDEGHYTILEFNSGGNATRCVFNKRVIVYSMISGLHTTSVGANSVNFSWDAEQGTSYNYQVSPSITPQSSLGYISTSSAQGSATLLSGSTTYYIHVQQTNCNAQGWTTLPFTTEPGGCYPFIYPGTNLGGGGYYCLGGTVNFTIDGTLSGQEYTILKDNIAVSPPLAGNDGTINYPMTITSANQAGTYTIRVSKAGCTTRDVNGGALVYINTQPVTGLVTTNITESSVSFSWNSSPGDPQYDYGITTNSTPVFTSQSYQTSETINSLTPSTTYYLHVRPRCESGTPLNPTTISFTTTAIPPPNCNTPEVLNECELVSVELSGLGTWDFSGTYPMNSAGNATPGKERIFSFTPVTTGVYYFHVTGVTGRIDYLYKAAEENCNNGGWTGIRSINSSGRYPIGMLQAGKRYLFVLDNTSTTITAYHGIRICKANVAPPSLLNSCITITLPSPMRAYHSKEEYIIDNAGNLIMSLDLSKIASSMFSTSVSFYKNNNAIRRDNLSREYLDRNYHINFSQSFNEPIGVKLFFTNAELQALIDEPNDGIADVNSINDLKVSGGNSSCTGSSSSQSFKLYLPSASGAYDANSSFIQFTRTDVSYSTFFIHGGTTPLEYKLSIEGFEGFQNADLPLGWRQQQVSGTGDIQFVTSSTNPTTIPYNLSRYVHWNSRQIAAGSITRLISAPLVTSSYANVSVDFLWYNNNNTTYSTGPYLTEGVQLEYSLDGINWITAGSFIPRHDASLTAGTGQWKKKRVDLPAGAGSQPFIYVAFKFTSQLGDNCGLDAINFYRTPPCATALASITVGTVTANSVNFSWPSTAGITQYGYHVSTNPAFPFTGIGTTSTSATVSSLLPNTEYFILVRGLCSSGFVGPWTITKFKTSSAAPPCSSGEVINVGVPVTAVIAPGSGAWTFSGTYPTNSNGFATPGIEKVYQFTPPSGYVYYLEVLSTSGTRVDYLYKLASGGCSNTGWTGIDDMSAPGVRAIGYLNGGQTYYILLDNGSSTEAVTQTFKICKAGVAPPSIANSCISLSLPNSMPANNPKEEHLLDNEGNLIASFNFSAVTNAVGTVSASYYLNNGLIRRDIANREYLDRNFTISTTNTPANPVNVKLYYGYYTDYEKLRLEPDDGNADVTNTSDLKVSRVQQNCNGGIYAGPSSLLTPALVGSYDAGASYVQFNTPGFSTFFIHGGNYALQSTLCPGSNTSFSFNSLGAGYTYKWQVDNGSGFSDISNGGVYSGATTTTLLLTNPPTSYKGYKYRCVSTNGTTTVNGDVYTLKFVATWNGGANTLWSNAANWDCGVLPDQNTDVIIPPATNMPSVTSNASCRSIELKQNATLNIQPGVTLNITGQ